MGFLALIIPGLIVGFVARAVVKTGRRFGCLGTIVLGVAGSFVGGAVASMIADDGFELTRASWIGSVLGAVLILVIVRFLDSGE